MPGLGDLRVRGERRELVLDGAAGVGTGKPCISISSIERFYRTFITLFHMRRPCVVLVFDSSAAGLDLTWNAFCPPSIRFAMKDFPESMEPTTVTIASFWSFGREPRKLMASSVTWISFV